MTEKDYRALSLKLFFGTFALAIVARAVWIQTASDSRLEKLSNRQFQSKVTALPRRGLILDRNGEGLAISLKARSLFVRPEALKKDAPLKERERIIYSLAHILSVSPGQVSSKINSSKKFVWIKRQLSQSEEQAIKDKGLLEYGDSLGLAEEAKRTYPNQSLASHIVGSVNIDGQGIEGLEMQYESILSGQQTRVSSNKDALGRRIFHDDEGLLAIKDGQSILLTIDKSIQYEAEKALKKAVSDYDAKAGSAIVADVKTGEILALANYPTFNPNLAKNFSLEQRRNRAIADTYEPGSTFKAMIIAQTLERGKKADARVYCEKGSFIVGGKKISEAEAREKFEWLTLGEILKYSSNIGAAKLALEMGSQNVSQLFEKLGVGTKTGIDLPGEAAGILSKSELKSQVRLANVGFGHGFTVTPVQMLTYYLSIANGGNWIQPKLVKAVIAEDPDAIEKGGMRWKMDIRTESAKNRNIFSAKTSENVSRMLETVTQEGGTGIKAQLEEWPVAGKTGTAQKVDERTHKYSRSKYVASFVGFAPSKNPNLVAMVMIDEPRKKYYGSETAAPAFREVMRASLLRQGVQPINSTERTHELANRSMIESVKKNDIWSATKKITQQIPVTTAALEEGMIRVPDLQGFSVRESLRTISNEPFDVEIIGSGILKNQLPAANEWVKPGTKLKLVFEK